MTKRLAMLWVYAHDPCQVADDYEKRLALRRRAEIPARCALMSRAADPIWLAVVDSKCRGGVASLMHLLPQRTALKRMTFVTATFARDAAWLSRCNLPTETRFIASESGPVRCLSTLCLTLGLVVDLIEDPALDKGGPCLSPPVHALFAGEVGIDSPTESRAATEVSPTVSGGPLERYSLVDHMAIEVTDLEEALVFVSELLGFKLVEEHVIPSGEATARIRVSSDDRGFQIVLGESRGSADHPIAQSIAARGGSGVHHIAHRVGDLAAAVRDMRLAQGRIEAEVQESSGLGQVFTRVSEDGLIHELIERREVSGFVRQNTAGLIQAGGRKAAV